MREKEIEKIWQEFHPKLQVYLIQLFPHIKDCEDRVSEILLKVFEQLDKYNSDYALSTWIYRIARNSQIDEIRKKQLSTVAIESIDLSSETTPESIYLESEDREEIKTSIEQLEPLEKELIYLHYYEEITYGDISEITGIPVGTIKYKMHHIRHKLKNKLTGSRI